MRELTEKLKKRFCTDNKISIKVYDEPYFTERLKLVGMYENFVDFSKMIEEKFDNNEEAYFSEYNNVKDKIIDFIKNSEGYNALQTDDMNKFASKYSFPQGDVYKETNIGKKFISLDMKKANFSALVYYSKLNGYKFFDSFDWNDFMLQFTDNKHIINSKYIRQVVFGNCNPKRQVAFEKHIMCNLLSVLLDKYIIDEKDVYCLCSDEIILRADTLSNTAFKDIITEVSKFSDENVPIRVEKYTVGKVCGSEAYVKRFEDKNTYDLKCVRPDEMPLVYKTVLGVPITENDLVFDYEGRLAKFIDTPNMYVTYE